MGGSKKVDLPEGSIIYTIGVLESRIGGSTFLDPPGAGITVSDLGLWDFRPGLQLRPLPVALRALHRGRGGASAAVGYCRVF